MADVILSRRLLLASTTTANVALRNTAKNCIFIFLAGAPSQTDMWDLKEGSWTPSDLAPTPYGDHMRALQAKVDEPHRVCLAASRDFQSQSCFACAGRAGDGQQAHRRRREQCAGLVELPLAADQRAGLTWQGGFRATIASRAHQAG